MVPSEIEITKEEYVHRSELISFYNNEVGVKELASLVLISGLLSEISDSSQVIAHNIAVRKLEEIGILDEEGLEPLIKYLLTRGSEKNPSEEN